MPDRPPVADGAAHTPRSERAYRCVGIPAFSQCWVCELRRHSSVIDNSQHQLHRPGDCGESEELVSRLHSQRGEGGPAHLPRSNESTGYGRSRIVHAPKRP